MEGYRRPLQQIAFVPRSMEIGMIGMWSGAIVDIPNNYHLCDGTGGTPDLRDKFVVGAGTTYNPDDSGGSVTHTHTQTGPTSAECEPSTGRTADGAPTADAGHTHTLPPQTGSSDGRPPYYSLAYIQRIR